MHTYACQHALTTDMWNHVFDGWGFAEYQPSLLWSVCGNPHYSWIFWDIWIKFYILIYFNIVQPLVGKTVIRVCRASFCLLRYFSENAHNSWTALYCIYSSNFAYLYILTLYVTRHCQEFVFSHKSQDPYIRYTTWVNKLPCCKDICYFVV